MKEKEAWARVKKHFQDKQVVLSSHWSYNILNDPKRLAFVLSRYKFAAKLACGGRSVLELGCSEGIGVPILTEFAIDYLGVDLDAEAIATARTNWSGDKNKFLADDFIGKKYGQYDSVISLDVIEHIARSKEARFFRTIMNNLKNKCVCVIGTPNALAASYASPASRAGHVNLYEPGRLVAVMKKYFRRVWLFGQNDEIVHTGFSLLAHYLIAVGIDKRKGQG